MMWYYKEENGCFSVGSIPMKEIKGVNSDGVEINVVGEYEDGWVLIDTRPEPHDDYVFDGSKWIAKEPKVLSTSELKALGKQYNGYQVPLDEEAQIAVTSVAVQYLAGMFSGTVFHFSNGTKMPCSLEEFLPFATWFATERNAFFTL